MNTYSLVAILISSLVGAAVQADTCGQLAGVRGANVEILRMQRDRGAQDAVRYAMKIAEKSSTPVECDDVILAGKDSSARIILPNAKLSLGSDSRIEIAEHAGAKAGSEAQVGLLNLTYGKLRALVNRKRGDNGESVVTKKVESGAKTAKATEKTPEKTNGVVFRIRTFSAVAGVRGTDFYVSYDMNSGLTQQATIEGAVEVAQSGTTQKVLVDTGHQVAVETTPQAVREAQERIKSAKGDEKVELPKQLPTDENVKPLKVVAINEATRDDLRRTSAAVSDDRDFSTKKAVETLGAPSTWTIKREAIPDSLKKLKNEY